MARLNHQNRLRQQKYYYRTKLRELGVEVDKIDLPEEPDELKVLVDTLTEKPNVSITLANGTEVRGKKLEVRSKKLESNCPDSSDEKYGDDSPYMKLAKRLFGHIRKRNPKHKEPNWQTWADDFRKTVELDDRDGKEVTAILDWCQNDDFWQNNILSPAKFRKQYDKLYLQVQKVKPQKREWDEWDALS